jgi:hypothetical protein
MDFQHSDIFELVADLREAARTGEWERACELAALLPLQTMPSTEEELGIYLHCLKEALLVGKASRAHSAAALVRVNAAVSFNSTRVGLASTRQECGDTANF